MHACWNTDSTVTVSDDGLCVWITWTGQEINIVFAGLF